MSVRPPLMICAFALLLLPFGASYADGRPELEGWRSDFEVCRKEATQKNRPLVLLWGTDKCPHCRKLSDDIATNSVFTAWRKESGFIFCHVVAKTGKAARGGNAAKTAKIFAATAGGTRDSQPISFPYVCLYHKRSDGRVSALSFTTESSFEVMEAARKLFSGVSVTTNDVLRIDTEKAETEITPASFSGSYTVQLPLVGVSSNALLRGVGSLALSIRPSFDGNVTSVTYSATLPDGSSFSGMTPFRIETVIKETGATSKVARVDVEVKMEKGFLKLPLKITPFGARAWKNPSVPEGLPSVFAADGLRPVCRLGGNDVEQELAVYGGFLRRGRTPKQLCELFDLSPRMSLKIRSADVVSERYGKAKSWPRGKINAQKNGFSLAGKKGGFSLSYDNTSGFVAGTGTIQFADYATPCELKGVVLPGWLDCHCGTGFTPRPFAAGLLRFKDFVKEGENWVAVIRSVPFELVAK